MVDAVLDGLEQRGRLVRSGSEIRLASHRVTLDERSDEVERLVAAVAAGEPTPPSVADLTAGGFLPEIVDAAGRAGSLVRVTPDIVMTPGFVAAAEAILREASDGITVSTFRERVGTSRKYAVPLLEWFDQQGVTRRQGDRRYPRGG